MPKIIFGHQWKPIDEKPLPKDRFDKEASPGFVVDQVGI